MTPHDFIDKWKKISLNERASAQEHFIDLCRLMNHPTPAEDDPIGERFTFEKGVMKTGGTQGYADVWKKGYFALEYKKKKRDLNLALEQLTRYAAALENPPLHIVCDTVRFIIETRWTNTIVERHEFELDELADPKKFKILHAAFHNPESLRPTTTRADITREAADKFQTISDRLQHRYPDKEAVAHFVNQLVFCFFANSVKLLPEGLWRKLLEYTMQKPSEAKLHLDKLFSSMESGGGIDFTAIKHFNGGLFAGSPALTLQQDEIALLIAANSLDWSLIDPTIFGTLFERFLDPDKRAQIGAHYTDPSKIMLVIEPVIQRPLEAEWQIVRAQIQTIMSPVTQATTAQDRKGKSIGKTFDAARVKAENIRDDFLNRLAKLRILDPACGSGNFLYLALQVVKDIEYKAILECETFGLGRTYNRVGPEILHGIEINTFAAELARTTIWIGDIQWEIRNAIMHRPEPILRNLNTIECRDALLTKQGGGYVAAQWPEVDYIVGNPPFLGGQKLRNGSPAKYKTVNGEDKLIREAESGLGDEYVDTLFKVYDGKLAGSSDLVCYWFYKAWEAINNDYATSVGLVTTNSIRGGANREVIKPIADVESIFECWDDEPWINKGASVRVSIVCFKQETNHNAKLNGLEVDHINADLSAEKSNTTLAKRLDENANIAFQGPVKVGRFDIDGELARKWLSEPLNVNGQSNSDILRPILNGNDIVGQPSGRWIIDFNAKTEHAASFYQSPFEYVKREIKPTRLNNNNIQRRTNWWRLGASGTDLRTSTQKLKRYISTPRVSKHRVFVWLEKCVLPDSRLFAIARDDDTTFGILHSSIHEAWSLATCSWHGVGNDPTYNARSCFETFPFPRGLTPNIPAKTFSKDPRAIRIAKAAKHLDNLRRNWLNPSDLVNIVPEVVAGFPDRILPKNVEAAAELKSRTLTNLYNQRPQWLNDAHTALDQAVASAYGWADDISIDDALANLLALNLERAEK